MISSTGKPNLQTILIIVICIAFFELLAFTKPNTLTKPLAYTDRQIVISAPLQVAMYAGDPYLAANIEEIRVAAVGPSEESYLTNYRIRAHSLVSELNPCHEDNTFLANAMLSWGGASKIGNEILERATKCRFWDEIPPFLLGFNLYFFTHKLDAAKHYIDIAEQRSSSNKQILKKISIMIEARQLNDEAMALKYLQSQKQQADDPKLIAMLDKRIVRLEGLITLRNAAKIYQKKHHKPLKDPNDLVKEGILHEFPDDPTKIGYQFKNGKFEFRTISIGGVEIK